MKEKTLHVVNGMSARSTLRKGFALMNMKENIVYLPIDFSIGYIPKDFSDKELCFALASHNNIKAFDALKKFVKTDYSVYNKVIVWHGWSAYDLLLLYLMSVLVKENLYQVDIRDCEAFIKKQRCEYPDMGYVSPYNVFEYNMISLAKPISEQEQIYYQKRWQRWTNSKTSYRFSSSKTGIIKEYPNDYFDKDIVEAVKKYSSLMHVVGEVMWKYYDLFIPDSIIYNRLNQLYWKDMFHLTITINEEKKRNVMNIKDLLQDDALKALEDQIIMSFEGLWSKDHDYTDERSLIEVRKTIINHRVLQHQDLLLPDIIAFNDAMREALREMFDKAHAVYEANKGFGEDVEVEACCYLSNDYPTLHPVQGENRQELWDALQDSGWNLLYEYGVSFPLQLRGNDDPDSNDFDEFIGMNCPPPNWNEGLDQELTKDLHLTQAFHNLFDHTDFAITDFIYCRDFYYEIKVEFRNEAQQNH